MKGKYVFIIITLIITIVLTVANLYVWGIIATCICIFILVLDLDMMNLFKNNTTQKIELSNSRITKLELRIQQLEARIKFIKNNTD